MGVSFIGQSSSQGVSRIVAPCSSAAGRTAGRNHLALNTAPPGEPVAQNQLRFLDAIGYLSRLTSRPCGALVVPGLDHINFSASHSVLC